MDDKKFVDDLNLSSAEDVALTCGSLSNIALLGLMQDPRLASQTRTAVTHLHNRRFSVFVVNEIRDEWIRRMSTGRPEDIRSVLREFGDSTLCDAIPPEGFKEFVDQLLEQRAASPEWLLAAGQAVTQQPVEDTGRQGPKF